MFIAYLLGIAAVALILYSASNILTNLTQASQTGLPLPASHHRAASVDRPYPEWSFVNSITVLHEHMHLPCWIVRAVRQCLSDAGGRTGSPTSRTPRDNMLHDWPEGSISSDVMPSCSWPVLPLTWLDACDARWVPTPPIFPDSIGFRTQLNFRRAKMLTFALRRQTTKMNKMLTMMMGSLSKESLASAQGQPCQRPSLHWTT